MSPRRPQPPPTPPRYHRTHSARPMTFGIPRIAHYRRIEGPTKFAILRFAHYRRIVHRQLASTRDPVPGGKIDDGSRGQARSTDDLACARRGGDDATTLRALLPVRRSTGRSCSSGPPTHVPVRFDCNRRRAPPSIGADVHPSGRRRAERGDRHRSRRRRSAPQPGTARKRSLVGLSPGTLPPSIAAVAHAVARYIHRPGSRLRPMNGARDRDTADGCLTQS